MRYETRMKSASGKIESRKPLFFRTATGILLVWLCACGTSINPAYAVDKTAAGKTRPTVLTGGINQLISLCAASGLTLSKPAIPAEVSNVRLGSTAAYSGVRQGDTVIDARVNQNILTLTLQRGQKQFQTQLAVDSKALTSMIPKTQPITPPPPAHTLLGETESQGSRMHFEVGEQEAEKILANYNFIVLVDRSSSMSGSIDQQGLGQSKFSWLQSNISDFASFLQAHTKSTLTVIPFNARHSVQELSSPIDIATVVRNLSPEGGTNLAAPLDEGIHLALRRTTPQIVVVLSDGMTNIGRSLEQTIINATDIVPAGQVVASFIQIGTDRAGLNAIKNLDDGLIARGAKYDMVDAKYFGDLTKFGMKRVLADAILQAKAPR